MIEHPDVIDFARARARRLGRKASIAGVVVRLSGNLVALYGPDRGWFLYPGGAGERVHWLTFDEAEAALDGHLTSTSPGS